MDARKEAEKLHQKVKEFILCANDSDGFPTAKAVLPAKNRDSLEEIFFVTNTHSKYVAQIKADNKASVYFYDPIFYKGCLLKGHMEVVSDIAIKESLWQNSYNGAYPEPDKKFNDPDFCVLRFTPINGRYYYMFKQYDFEI